MLLPWRARPAGLGLFLGRGSARMIPVCDEAGGGDLLQVAGLVVRSREVMV